MASKKLQKAGQATEKKGGYQPVGTYQRPTSPPPAPPKPRPKKS
jgi:hypothetical protein